uniref:Uncharacterized protein n=1 Tax=Ditylenchus dipsaci TaxID=166011 RepID=A0A915D5D8_9BILA
MPFVSLRTRRTKQIGGPIEKLSPWNMSRNLTCDSQLSLYELDSIYSTKETHWELKQTLEIKGGGVLKKFSRQDDPDSILYDLKVPGGKTVVLQKYLNQKSIHTYDPETCKVRYISSQ